MIGAVCYIECSSKTQQVSKRFQFSDIGYKSLQFHFSKNTKLNTFVSTSILD